MKHRLIKVWMSVAVGVSAIVIMVACVSGNPSKAFDKAVQSGKTLIKIGSYEVREGYLDVIGRMNPQLKSQIASPMGRKKLLDTITEQELLYQGSLKEGLQNDPKVLEKIGLYSRVIISQAMVEKELQKRVKEYYDSHKQDEFEQVQISDIFVKVTSEPAKTPDKTPDAAAAKETQAAPTANEAAKKKATETLQAVQEKLKQGGDFGALAAETSDDAVTKKKNGDLGWVSRNEKRLVRKDWQPLLDKAFAMKVGDVSDIIETKDGLHIIKVVTGPKLVPLEEAENAIRLKVGANVKKEVLEKLKKETKVSDLSGTPVAPESGAAPTPPMPHGHPHPHSGEAPAAPANGETPPPPPPPPPPGPAATEKPGQ